MMCFPRPPLLARMAEKVEHVPLAESRPRRSQAGRNIGKLIDQEQEGDEFYKTAYGGFEEESADEEYEEEDSEDDEVDSDFDVDESTWNQEDDGEQQLQLMEQKKKKKQWLKPTKLKLPAPPVPEPALKPPKAKKPRTTALPAPMDAGTSEPSEQRSLRKSTLEVSEEFRRRMQEEEEIRQFQRSRKSAARKKPQRRLTQKEMLEEAEQTERENLASLEAYARLEAEKRKVKAKKTGIQGPFIRYHSVTMPAITELPDPVISETKQEEHSSQGTISTGETIGNSSAAQNQSTVGGQLVNDLHPTTTQQAEPQTKYCRNFLIFTDTINYPSGFFPTTKPQKPRKKFCPVTGLPARYKDPITGTPYATSQAFRVIRNKYISEGEQKCEKRLLQLSSWLEEKKRKKMESKSY